MTRAHPDDAERFDTGGRVTGWIGLAASLGVVVVWVASLGHPLPLWVLSGAVLAALLFWSAIIRPRVWASEDMLVLRNMFEDVRIPLAAIEEHAVRQVLAVRAGDKRYVGTGVGRSLAAARAGTAAGTAAGATSEHSSRTRTIHPADYVETRIAGLTAHARERARIERYSDQQAALAAGVERTPTWLVIAPLLVASVVFVLSILLR